MKQKLFLLADIMIILAAVGLVALNMWVCRFPEWVILIAVLLVIAVNIFYLVKFKTKLVAKIALPLISVIAICFSLFGSYCNPYWNSLLCRSVEYTKPYDEVITYKQAKADIDYIMHYLKKCHPLFVNGTPDNVQQSYNNSIERLQSADEITVNTLLSNGFIINQIVEPQPPENMMDIPGMQDEMRRPMMLIVSANKKMDR